MPHQVDTVASCQVSTVPAKIGRHRVDARPTPTGNTYSHVTLFGNSGTFGHPAKKVDLRVRKGCDARPQGPV